MEVDIRTVVGQPVVPPKVKVGVLYKDLPVMDGVKNPITGKPILNRKPIYIVEYINDPTSFDMVIVYGVEPSSKPPVKAFTRKEEVVTFDTRTPLGALAQQRGKKRKRVYTEENPPKFVSPVYLGVDTFTGYEGLGFHERLQDVITAKGVSHMGETTNVFITLNSIDWQKDVIITTDILQGVQAIKDVWFNL